jgi:uncharacterized protein YfdQ (DUF2303 family)
MRRYKNKQKTEKMIKTFATIAALSAGIMFNGGCKEEQGEEQNMAPYRDRETNQFREMNLLQLDAYRRLYSIVLEIPFARDRLTREELVTRLNEVTLDQEKISRLVLTEAEDLRRILNSENEPTPMQLAFIRERFHQRSIDICRTIAFLNSRTELASY